MLALWGVVLVMRLSIPRDLRIWAGFLVMGALNNAMPFALLSWGQLYIETGLTSILNAATAIFGVLMAAIFFQDERLSLRKLVGVSFGFAGVATAIGLENLRYLDLRSLAQLAVIGATICYALAAVWARKMLSGLPPQTAAAGMLTGATALILPVAWLVEGPLTLDLQPRTIGAIAYFSLCSTALAYLLYYRLLTQVGSGNLMLVTLLVAPVAIVLGTVVLGESLQPSAYAGFALLAIGLIVLDGRIWHIVRRWGSQKKTL